MRIHYLQHVPFEDLANIEAWAKGKDHSVSKTELFKGEGCANQAFEYDGRVIGLQFHLESTVEGVNKLIRNCGDSLSLTKYVQIPREILSQHNNFLEIERVMNKLLNCIEGI
ncbi:MAG: glutamine amidotransferase [Candidatus Methanolliviera sp. GoM_oil]|nr:MAG: glutamine amidotransferase [Candidatus Methanolliviera sp. GoM_oil]